MSEDVVAAGNGSGGRGDGSTGELADSKTSLGSQFVGGDNLFSENSQDLQGAGGQVETYVAFFEGSPFV